MQRDDEIAALCKCLDAAHELLEFIVRYDGVTTPEFVQKCCDWIEGEYSPHQGAEPCNHLWKKAAIDSSMHCVLCGLSGGEFA